MSSQRAYPYRKPNKQIQQNKHQNGDKNLIEKLVLLNNNPPSEGVGRYAYSLHRSLKTIGIKHVFLSLENDIINETFYKLKQLGLGIEWPYAIFKYNIIFHRLKISKALVHVLNHGYLAVVVPRLKEQGNKVIVTVHDLIPLVKGLRSRSSLLHIYLRRAFRSIEYSDYIIYPSHSVEKELSLYFGHIPSKVIHLGVDHEVFKPRDKYLARVKLGLPVDRPLILNVGTEEPRKNIPTLLKAFKILLREIPDAVLIRVGRSERSTVRIIKKLGLQSKVIYRRASDDEIGWYYNAADVLVHTAYYEGFGLPPLEAMASGTPVVASKIPSILECVGNAAIIIDPFDYQGFAEAITRVLTDRKLSESLSYLGYKRSHEFTWEKTAKETAKIYINFLNG